MTKSVQYTIISECFAFVATKKNNNADNGSDDKNAANDCNQNDCPERE
jgi:hypothetical protein